ncbi:MAG TPA: hypothetical protein VN429_00740 [Methanospirillum sp.]|uniref:hypothetical protein n=1 Tax=Methanospirillum sp. TaxID=45200 RepID=UPI002C3CD67E|nr:hypothetical protein [Methanospirillum sp.]HWQ62910.1 hypothetical protein [Methanospirillum sp.]
MATQTIIGRLQKLKLAYGLSAQSIIYLGQDGDATAESASANAPAQELTTGGCGRTAASVADVSSGTVTAMKLTWNLTFTGDNVIRALFGSWSNAPGQNMAWRHVMSLAQAVGQNDQMTVTVTDTLNG